VIRQLTVFWSIETGGRHGLLSAKFWIGFKGISPTGRGVVIKTSIVWLLKAWIVMMKV